MLKISVHKLTKGIFTVWNKLPQKEASIETIRADQEKGMRIRVCENAYAVMCVHMCIIYIYTYRYLLEGYIYAYIFIYHKNIERDMYLSMYRNKNSLLDQTQFRFF